MTEQAFWSVPRLAGGLLSVAFVPLALGITLFLSRGGLQGAAPRTQALFILERGSILTAVILTALGFLVLEMMIQGSSESAMVRIGAMAYFFGAVVLVTAEAMGLIGNGISTYPLIVVYVIMALLGQAAIGLAIVQITLLPAWVGWATIVWNLAWLLILPLGTPGDVYFPILHHLMPLLIGIPLFWKG